MYTSTSPKKSVSMTAIKVLLLVTVHLPLALSFVPSQVNQKYPTLSLSSSSLNVLFAVDGTNEDLDNSATATELHFEQNSKLMYSKILEVAPRFVRKVVQKNVDKVIADMCDDVVTESDMYEIIRRASPKPFVKYGIDILDEYRSH